MTQRYTEKIRKYKTFLTRKNHLYGQLACVLIFNVFAGIALSGGFIEKQSLYWDNLNLFSFFRDNLHSLNYFGEIQWWHRSAQTSFPIYYSSILGTTCATPLFAILGTVLWVFGRFGLYVTSYHFLYVIYTGFVVPLLFNIGLLLLARQIFKRQAVILFVIMLGSVSPGVIFNLSSVGLEETAYGLFFAAAYLAFIKRPGKTTFVPVMLSLLVLAVSLNHIFLYWNIIFIPLFVSACNIFSRDGFIGTAKRLVKSVPAYYWLATSILLAICMLPAVVTFGQGEDILRSISGSRWYSYSFLRPGNPLEVLSVGVPGIGFEWSGGTFNAHHVGQVSSRYVGYTYLGLMSLPLVFMGLIIGRRIWAKRLFFMIVVTSTIVILSAYSPFFSSILIWPTPLRAVNHYSDTLYRNGIFFIFILTAGLGLEAILRHARHWRKTLIRGFVWSSLWSILLFLVVYRTFHSPIFGFIAVMIFLYAIALTWFAQASTHQQKGKVIILLIFLTLLDVSTVAFWHVRNDILPYLAKFEEPAPTVLGGDSVISSYANNLLELRQMKELKDKGIDQGLLPVLALYDSVGTERTKGDAEGELAGREAPPMALFDEHVDAAAFLNFLEHQQTRKDTSGDIVVEQQTYNSIRLGVKTPHKALLFWRDAYFPYWTATVNGENSNIIKAFGAYKAVAVPTGESKVLFRFRPTSIAISLLAAYAAILAVIVLWFVSRFRQTE